LHQAALGSVPFSLERPIASHDSNVTGFLNLLLAARDRNVRRFVFASSSSVYGDDAGLPKVENRIGRPLSPYAATKLADEHYAFAFARNYGLETVGLRYFNVFGPRQEPDSPYAAVIPQWIASMIRNEPAYINGDGSTSRDFCYVANVVQANLLSAIGSNPAAVNEVFNVAMNAGHTLNALFKMLRAKLLASYPHLRHYEPRYRAFRPGDILHSCADISKATHILGYRPTHTLEEGLDEALDWYVNNVSPLEERSTNEDRRFESPQRVGGCNLKSTLA
jgi:UDP-N-acetylglucosamine 4-epimerase